MDHLLIGLFAASACLLSLATAGHALLTKRDPRSALVWTSLTLTLPLLGPFLYWCLGINRISRRARSWQASGRRPSGIELYPLDASLEVADVPSPPGGPALHDLHTLENRLVATPLRGGNRILPLVDGEAAYPAMLVAIRRARESINLSSYIFDADGIGAEFVAHLAAAAERGVEVRVIVDALGEKYSRISAARALAGTRVRLERYLPLRHGAYINLRNHRKLLVVDGSEAFTGGMNIRGRHLTTEAAPQQALHDLHFAVRGPVVHDLQRTFLEDWFFVSGERLDTPLFFPPQEPAGNAFVRCIGDGPDKEFRKLEQIILGALSCARRTVRIMTPYFVPDRPMIAALTTAALRGVRVEILLPGCNNLPFVQWAGQAVLRELLICGVRVAYQPPPFVHTKLLVVDDAWALVGSTNMDIRSLRLNFELDLSVFDAPFAGELVRHFERSQSAARPITRAELEGRPQAVKLRDSFCHLFAPYL